MTVLEDLYYGNITPFNEYYQNPETEIAINKNNKITDNLSSMLNTKEQRKAVNAVINSQSKVLALTEKDAFLAGLKLGIKIMAEVYSE